MEKKKGSRLKVIKDFEAVGAFIALSNLAD